MKIKNPIVGRTHRLKTKDNSNAPIILCIENEDNRNAIFKNAPKLKGSKINFTMDYSKKSGKREKFC